MDVYVPLQNRLLLTFYPTDWDADNCFVTCKPVFVKQHAHVQSEDRTN